MLLQCLQLVHPGFQLLDPLEKGFQRLLVRIRRRFRLRTKQLWAHQHAKQWEQQHATGHFATQSCPTSFGE
jgi:hypothetical protein